MPTETRRSGLRISLPETYASTDEPRPGGRRGRERPSGPVPLGGAAQADGMGDELVAALSGQFELVDRVNLNPGVAPTPAGGKRSRGAPAVPANNPIGFDLDVKTGESAIMLVEQDGVLSWVFGEESAQPAARRGAAASKTVRFEIDAQATGRTAGPPARRGFVSDLILRPIKAYVFKFAAGVVAGQVLKRLESTVAVGPVIFAGADPLQWRKDSDLSLLKLPQTGPCRILLFVHGTFSSTVGGFGALGASPRGKDFLDNAIAAYDCVLGFDHHTLSKDPLENAGELLAALRSLPCQGPIVLDAIVHSRGGLVIRSLVEDLLPQQPDWPGRFHRIVMVGSPNAGTGLALPENWRTFVDLYTNLAVAGTRAAAVFAPPAAMAALVLREVLEGVATFVKALATAMADESLAPGLSAMVPGGRFVTRLNQTQPNQPLPQAIDYYAIRSNFSTSGLAVGTGDSLPERLKKALADRLVDQIIGADNDLVVDVASMVNVDPQVKGYMRDVFDFGANASVFHTNYFLQEQTISSLERWLGMAGDLSQPTGAGRIVRDLPAVVSDDFLQLDTTMTVSEVRALLDQRHNAFAVLRRYDRNMGQVFHYAFRPPELMSFLGGWEGSKTLSELGFLHETQASGPAAPGEVSGFSERSADHPWTNRIVVQDDGRVLGVVPALAEMATAGAPPPAPPPAHSRDPKAGDGSLTARSGPPAMDPATPAAPGRDKQYFRAEMPRQVEAGRREFLTVQVSAEQLVAAATAASAAGAAQVDLSRQLTLTVVPKSNFRVIGEQRVAFMPVQSPQQLTFMFELEAGDPGPGEVWVVAQQGPLALVTLDLHVAIVAGSVPVDAGTAASSAATSVQDQIRPRHHLSIYETRNGAEVSYMFDFRSESLDVTEFGVTSGIANREEYVNSMYAEIEARWLASGADVENFNAEMRSYGADLFHQLVPQNIRKALWDNRSKIGSIEVISTEPFVPWEIVHLTPPDERRLAAHEEYFLGAMGMVRWLHGAGSAPAAINIRSGKVFAVVPQYPAGSGYELAETEGEFAFLQQTFDATRLNPQPMDVQHIIERPGEFDLLHFAGHGFAEIKDIGNSQIMLEGQVQDNAWVANYFSSNRVESYADLRQSDGNRPMVVLNACQVGRGGYKLTSMGGFAQAFIRQQAGAFISSLWSVGDAPARTFTETLYAELLGGKELAAAVSLARSAGRAAGDASWLAYVVYGSPYLRVRQR